MHRDSIAKLVRTAFATALDVEVDNTTDFFDAGGDSLASEQVIVTLSETLAVELPGWLLLDHPTIPALTGAIADLCGSNDPC
ncbi:acyl carrier protein [Aliisedimentitalea scapharcae]|uniref:Acyl carrier protein n=1 Tax=Aliisedimentitalea scapharcae TaxID=1524259 RepID=A0ABZ2XR73_9RHOB|nr:acyl carrier protein [Rhodobacteraceae bacterium M382]